MRIAFLSWESLHSISIGGVAVHVTELAAALERRGHEVHVFTRLGAWQSIYEIIDGVHYHRCPIDLDPDFVTEMSNMSNMSNSLIHFLGETEAFQGDAFDSQLPTIFSAERACSTKRIWWMFVSAGFLPQKRISRALAIS